MSSHAEDAKLVVWSRTPCWQVSASGLLSRTPCWQVSASVFACVPRRIRLEHCRRRFGPGFLYTCRPWFPPDGGHDLLIQCSWWCWRSRSLRFGGGARLGATSAWCALGSAVCGCRQCSQGAPRRFKRGFKACLNSFPLQLPFARSCKKA